MFRIANAVAYENKMIFGLNSANPAADGYDLGASAWVHVAGATQGRHVVPAQIALVTQAVMRLYRSKGRCHPCISFRPSNGSSKPCWKASRTSRHGRNKASVRYRKATWTSGAMRSVGTVHTFQGKEERIVWMVLGCDDRGAGAVSWAVSKPNILNVALTRAKQRFFMIGDMRLWGGKRYFQEASLNSRRYQRMRSWIECGCAMQL